MPFHSHVSISKEIWLCHLLPMSITNWLQATQHAKQKLASWGKGSELLSCSQLLQRLTQSAVWLRMLMKYCDFWHLCFLWALHSYLAGCISTVRSLPACGTPCSWSRRQLLPCFVLRALHPSATTQTTTGAEPEHSTVQRKEVPGVWWMVVVQLQSISLPRHSCPFHTPFKYQLHKGDPLQVF